MAGEDFPPPAAAAAAMLQVAAVRLTKQINGYTWLEVGVKGCTCLVLGPDLAGLKSDLLAEWLLLRPLGGETSG